MEKNKPYTIEMLDTVDSTNDYLLNHYEPLANNLESIKVVLAQQQTQGRGRFNRPWVSPYGENIYFSCQMSFQKKMSELSGLSLVVSLAIVKTLKLFMDKNALWVKWPNDIFFEDSKLSGSLIDIAGEHQGMCTVIIGIGINVNMTVEPDALNNPISQAWTSVKKITRKNIDKNLILSALIENLIEAKTQFENQGVDFFIAAWQQYDGLFGKNITLKVGNTIVKGKAAGINSQGHLLVKLQEGHIQAFSSGEASILKNN